MPYLKPRKYISVGARKIKEQIEQVNRKLVYVGGEIRFQSEIDLEDYIEENFSNIFPDWILVKRQYSVKMQRCDLLCSTKSDKQPVIIELKNEEDRYIVSQLVRYRKAILTEKPFADKINYSLPVKLVAICPTFHQDNYRDKEACKFEDDFCFWQFSIENYNNSGKFKLLGNTYDIPYPVFGLPDEQSSYSDSKLGRFYSFAHNFSNKIDRKYEENFWSLRALFKAQPKIKEMVNSSYTKILYGTGDGQNHKKLAEITNTPRGLCLYLWLPTPVETRIKIPVARYGLVIAGNSNPFCRNSIVEYLICTKDTINVNDRAKLTKDLLLGQSGFSKWCRANLYLDHASLGSKNTFWLLLDILKGIKPSIDNATSQWWSSYKTQTPSELGWYIDLAIKTWNYRFK